MKKEENPLKMGKLNKPKKEETVTLDRLINFYKFIEKNNWSGSLIIYKGNPGAWINTYGNGVFEGRGDTFDEALTDILNELSKKGMF